MSFFTNPSPNRRYGTPQQQQRPPLSGGLSSGYRGASPSRMTNAKTNALFDALVSGALQQPLTGGYHHNRRSSTPTGRNNSNMNSAIDHRATPKSHEMASVNLLRQSLLETTSALEEARRRCHELTLRNEHLAHELNQVKDENSRIYSQHSTEMADARGAVERTNERLRTISAREEDARAEAAHWRRRAIENGITNTASGVSAFVSSPPPPLSQSRHQHQQQYTASYYSPIKSSANAVPVTATALPSSNNNKNERQTQQQQASSRATSLTSSATKRSNNNNNEEMAVEEPVVTQQERKKESPPTFLKQVDLEQQNSNNTNSNNLNKQPANYRNSPSVQAPNLSPTRRSGSGSDSNNQRNNNNNNNTGANSLSSSARRYINEHVVADSVSQLDPINNAINNNQNQRKPSPTTPALVQSPRRNTSANHNNNVHVLSRSFDDSWAQEALDLERGMEETKQRLRSILGSSSSTSMPRSSPTRRY